METLQKTIQESLYTQSITPQETLIVGLSGGRDSVCLTFCLKELSRTIGFSLEAVHVNHHLRETADRDEAFCKDLCERWEIPLTVRHGDVKRKQEEDDLSLEDAARRVRYTCFKEALRGRKNARIVLAHHAMDQAETLLLHLLRGSGLKGLTGMAPFSVIEGVPVLRPMLECSDDAIIACVKDHALTFVEDETNRDLAFTRNKIRHEVVPILASINPSYLEGFTRTAKLLREDEAALMRLAEEAFAVDGKGGLVISCLTGEKAIDLRILKKWLKTKGLDKDIEQVHLEDLLDICLGRTGRSLMLPHGLTVQKSYDILNTTPAEIREKSFDQASVESERKVLSKEEFDAIFPDKVPDLLTEKYLDLDKITGEAVWRFRLPGDYLALKDGRQKLKDLLINEKVPRQDRDRIPILTDETHVLWVLGSKISEDVKVTEKTKRVLCIKVRPEAIQIQ